jgi:protein O-mannosyl-transferase
MSKQKNKESRTAARSNTPQQPKPTTAHTPSEAVAASVPTRWMLAGCLVLTLLIFANTLGAGFVNWDDHGYLWLNPLVQPLSGKAIADMFTGHTCGAYSPLVVLTYCIEHGFDKIVKPGQQVADNFNPAIYHFTNVLLHLGATALSFFLFRGLGLRGWALAFATALFGIHPMRVESVAWITERKDVLYGFFYIGALITYWKYITQTEKKSLWYAATLALGILSVFSKIQAVCLPLSMLVLDYWAGRDMKKAGTWLEKAPFFALSLALGLTGIHFVNIAEGFKDTGYPLGARLLFAAWSLCVYVGRTVFPLGLATYYPYPPVDNIPPQYYVAPLLLAALGYAIWRSTRQTKVIAFGFLFFLVNIAPVLQIKGAGKAFLADRFTYIPYIGLFFILAWGLQMILEGRLWGGLKKIAPLAAGGFIAVLSGMTFLQNATWKDSVTLWENATKKYPGDYLGWNNMGLALDEAGRYEEASKAYEQGNKVNPGNYDSFHNLGVALFKLKRYPESIKAFTQAAANKPTEPEIYWNRAHTYVQAGDHTAAIADYNRLLQMEHNRQPKDIYLNIGVAHAAMNRHDLAIEAFDKALKLGDAADIRYQKGNSIAAQGNMAGALEQYEAALKLNPEYADVWNNRGNALAVSGRPADAVASFDKAISLQPAPNMYFNRGMARNALGDRAGACADWQKAQQLGYAQASQLIAQLCGQ